MQDGHAIGPNAEILRLILSKIADGVLPSVRVEKVWAGYGTGHPCYGCDQPIDGTDVETEINLAGALLLRLHQRCFAIWQQELEIRGGTARASATSARERP